MRYTRDIHESYVLCLPINEAMWSTNYQQIYIKILKMIFFKLKLSFGKGKFHCNFIVALKCEYFPIYLYYALLVKETNMVLK